MAVAVVREHRTELPDPTAELGRTLDDVHTEPYVGQPDRCPQAGDPAADHHGAGQRLDHERLQRRRQPRLGDTRLDQSDRLCGRALMVVRVGPGGLLANVHLGVGVRVEVRSLRHTAEGDLVQLGRARSHHQTVQVLLPDVRNHLLLSAVGAREQRGLGDHHVGVVLERVAHLGHVDVVRDVATAVADVDADASVPAGTGLFLPADDSVFLLAETSVSLLAHTSASVVIVSSST